MTPKRKFEDGAPARRILIAIDFGTTYSGASWAQSARPEIQTVIDQWPQSDGTLEGATSGKVPTELFYDQGKCVWGFQINDSDQRHQWFKLGLDPANNDEASFLTTEYLDPHALPPDYEKDATTLSIDYLTYFHKHVISVLRLKLGAVVVDTTPIQFIITVPAIWSDAAKARTQACGKAAGMGDNVQIISEPEAAVIYALDAMDPHDLKVKDTFVLCDAGGGTVDLISYTITQLRPIVKIEEAVAGSGHACGSTFLNRIFRKWMEDNFSNHEGWGPDTLEEAMKKFEEKAKRQFAGGPEDTIIPVPGLVDDAAKCIKRGRLTITSPTMKTLFQPVLAIITTLVTSQLKLTKNARAVLLVGGFGQSPYLRECVKKVVGQAIEVVQPAQGWTAVVRGALIKGLNIASPDLTRITISSRVARKAYGMVAGCPFVQGIGDETRKWWCSFEGLYLIDEMHWFVKKGDHIEEDMSVDAQFSTQQPVSNGRFYGHTVKLLQFSSKSDESPPEYPGSNIKPLVKLTADLSTIGPSEIPIRKGKDGQDYYYLDFEVRVNFFSAHTEYSLWFKNQCYGSVKAEYA